MRETIKVKIMDGQRYYLYRGQLFRDKADAIMMAEYLQEKIEEGYKRDDLNNLTKLVLVLAVVVLLWWLLMNQTSICITIGLIIFVVFLASFFGGA